jgi:hypothetical protein
MGTREKRREEFRIMVRDNRDYSEFLDAVGGVGGEVGSSGKSKEKGSLLIDRAIEFQRQFLNGSVGKDAFKRHMEISVQNWNLEKEEIALLNNNTF